jgi:putative nucleotidyltransferase with HDIG domain
MRLKLTIFKSKVARRIFGAFVLCALVPVITLAVLAFGHVTDQLNEQNHRRIQQECKSIGMAILERLLFLEREMEAVAYDLRENPAHGTPRLSERCEERLAERFAGFAILGGANQYVPVHGRIEDPRWPSEEETAHLRSGKTVLAARTRWGKPSRIFMMRRLNPQTPEQGVLLGEINVNHLWGIGDMNTLPAMSELSVFDESNKVLLSSIPLPDGFSDHISSKINGSSERRFEWAHEGNAYLASHWTIFLKPQYLTDRWTVVLSQSKNVAFKPIASFKKTFPLVVLMSLWVVVFLSIIQIRRNLVPLEKLKEGTVRIGEKNFETPVSVTSGDEFEELAGSFNDMSRRLSKQFSTLATIAEIDRTVLGSVDTDRIVNTVLVRMGDVVPSHTVSVVLPESDDDRKWRVYYRKERERTRKSFRIGALKAEEANALARSPHHLLVDGRERLPSYLRVLAREGAERFLVLPILIKQKLGGIVSLGFSGSRHEKEDLDRARQVADQVGVALSNAGLIQELAQLNWGALVAFARAVDAKSPWTAGHSERVTSLALKIGRAMGLGQENLDLLKRGGLLHDLGKIGVPAEVLDKPGKLTDEEFRVMKNHSSMGARILEPISAYADVIPIVEQHHEKFDGSGYPYGLSGERICWGARILAVADVFDALVSARPYRSGWDREKALGLIKDQSGRHFDPDVVEAFFAVIEEEKSPLETGLAGVPQVSANASLHLSPRGAGLQ